MFFFRNATFKDILKIENLNIPARKITCILGPSGSGKTTLLKLLNKMISCDGGEILYNDKPLSSMNSVYLRREIVMLSQNAAIFKGSIRDNLLLGLKFSDKTAVSDEILNDTLRIVHLNKNLDTNSENLSGGEKQRLALGRVLLLNPECLLLDEPSSALDEATEQLVLEKVSDYAKKNNKTLIIVTHSKKVAETFADYIVTIENGRVSNFCGQDKEY